MITKLIRVFGIIFIISFSVLNIFMSLITRDLDNQPHNQIFKKYFSYPSFFEDRFFDNRMKQTIGDNNFNKNIVLAEINDDSLHTLGRWPIPRRHWVTFTEKMYKFGAKVLVWDVFFAEPEVSCGDISPDTLLANSFSLFTSKPGNKIILPYKLNVDGTKTDREFEELPGEILEFIMNSHADQKSRLKNSSVSKDAYPLKELLVENVGLAHIQATEDFDGIYRHYYLVRNIDDLYFPSFSLLAYQYFTNDQGLLLQVHPQEEGGGGILKLKNGSLDVNDLGQAKVRWFGDESSFPKVSIKDIVQSSDDDPKMIKIFKDNVVFIGSTAYGAHDLRHTPLHPQMPGVYFHMNMLDMLLQNRFFHSSDESNQYSFLLLIIGTILIILIQMLGHPILDILGVVTLTAGIYIFDTYYLLPDGYEIKLFFCLFSILSCYSWNTLLNFYLSNKDKAFLKSAFSNYISPELIDEMYDSGQPPELGGSEQLLTAYFTDIASFSTFSENLTATQLVELLNEYLTAMTDILLKENGTLDKYEGDAIIAFFGAPMPLEDHAVRACSVAIHMQKALDDLRIKWKSEEGKWPEIVCEMRMRIGINSGNIVTGNMGSTQRMNYTMMGDSVNLAARLEEAAKQYGIYTHVNEDTKVLTENKFEMRILDTIKVVGKTKPVTTYDLLGFVGKTSEDLLQLKNLFEKALEYYKRKQFDNAIEQFKQSLVYENLRYPELEGKKTNPSLIYIARCEEYLKNPPPEDWDGVYTLTSK